jgi:hypothetical protein
VKDYVQGLKVIQAGLILYADRLNCADTFNS